MKIPRFSALASSALLALGAFAFAGTALGQSYEISITNLTAGQTFTPPVAVVHTEEVQPFTLGQPASDELVALAEAGDTAPLVALLETLPAVGGLITGDEPIAPGATGTLVLEGAEGFDRVAVASMLVPTNDGFYALNGELLPAAAGESVTYFAYAYDAGSETNDELCASIPGPPDVCAGEGLSPEDTGEGYVHIHRGIHGIGDLVAADRDWRNPVAMITIVAQEGEAPPPAEGEQ